MNAPHRLVPILLLFLSACAAQAMPPAAAAPVQAASAPAQDLKQAWWNDNRWRYGSDEAADAAYQTLLGRQSPWPEWHQPSIVTLPAGLRFQVALSPGQGTDCPGAFGTFDRIPDLRYVRYSLAVKIAWKPEIDRVATYEIVTPLPADTGVVGPQVDTDAGRYLPGGGSQFETAKGPCAERAAHLRVVEVRPVH
jgi:hypothetical protein